VPDLKLVWFSSAPRSVIDIATHFKTSSTGDENARVDILAHA